MELLKELFAIHSPSGDEKTIRKFIRKWVDNVPGCKVKGDGYGNMYIIKGCADLYPCVVAHLDQVQSKYPKDYKVIETDDIIFGYSPVLRSYCGLGADDKCGIWIALNCLKEFDAIKIAFFSGEEVGCIGSSKCEMSFFDDTMYIVEPDRRGSKDLITEIGFGSICSDEFIDAINPQHFGYTPEHGLMTDVETLRNRGYKNSCINLSCGYYEPHTDNEFVVKDDVINALNFVRSIITNVKQPYPFKGFDSWNCFNSYEEDYLYDILDSYGDDVVSMDPEIIYEDVKDFVQLRKKKIMWIIRDWQYWRMRKLY